MRHFPKLVLAQIVVVGMIAVLVYKGGNSALVGLGYLAATINLKGPEVLKALDKLKDDKD